MQYLKTHTVTTQNPAIFLVYWTNTTMRPRGIIKVHVSADIEDKHIAAEMAAMKHLLEEKFVVGNNVVGNPNMHLVVSLGAIRKLQRMQSDKDHLAPYANFIRTRFAGCKLTVEKDDRWTVSDDVLPVEDLLVSAPVPETVAVLGIGEVVVTHHALIRFAERYLSETPPEKAVQLAWQKLTAIAAERTVREVVRTGSKWLGMKKSPDGKAEGRYFLNPNKNLVLVVTDNPVEGKRLVTTYPANHQFRELQRAA